jgi:hypothetical protein
MEWYNLEIDKIDYSKCNKINTIDSPRRSDPKKCIENEGGST